MTQQGWSRADLISKLEAAQTEIKSLRRRLAQSPDKATDSHNIFQTVFENSNDAIFVIDPDRDMILEVNPRACRILGYSYSELIALPISQIHPQEMERLRAFARHVHDAGTGWTDELTCLTKGGISLSAEISASSVTYLGRKCIIALVRDISERKEAEAALRSSQQRLQALFDSAADAFFIVDAAGQFIDVNQQACVSLGYERAELLALKLWDVSIDFVPEKNEMIMQQLQKVPVATLDGTHVRKDGSRFPVEVRVCLFGSPEANLRLAIARDVSERVQAEQIIRASEARYRRLYHQTPVMMHSIDRQGRLISVNEFWLKILGYQREEVIGRKGADFLTETSREFALNVALPRLLREGVVNEIELQMVKKNGDIIDVLLTATSELQDNDEFSHSLAFVVDVTERNQAERALRESEMRLNRIIGSAMDAIVAIDAQYRIILLNPAAEKVFDISHQAVQGQSFTPFLAREFEEILREYISATVRGEAAQYSWLPEGVTAVRGDGSTFPVEGTIAHAEMSGRPLLTLILRDVNERLRAEAALNQLRSQNIYLQEEIQLQHNFGEIVGKTASMQAVYQSIEKVAPTDSTVLLFGETGTGKELVARAIHKLSGRRDQVLVTVNCAALSAGLVESELFGHEKGAFTGATALKKGRFELADSGTLFLDEVGELPIETQTKLLRILQEQTFERVGATRQQRVDVRVIAATNLDLEEAVRIGGFRADLYYRLNIFPITIPPLRDRIDDIPLLADYFLAKFSKRLGKRLEGISDSALGMLMSYHWPGNVREFANLMERAVILCSGGPLRPEHFSETMRATPEPEQIQSLADSQRQQILAALEKTGGVVAGPRGAAALLGINRSTLISRMKKLGIYKKSNR